MTFLSDPTPHPPVPTITLAEAHPGDVVLCHSAGFVGRAIRIAQRIRTPAAYCTYNHAALLVAVGGDPEVIQAEAHGVERSYLSDIASGGSYVIVALARFPSIDGHGIDVDRVLAYAEHQVGDRYDFLTIASIFVNLLLPRFIDLRSHRGEALGRDGTLICSALVARSLEHGGGVMPADPFEVTPAEIGQLAASHA